MWVIDKGVKESEIEKHEAVVTAGIGRPERRSLVWFVVRFSINRPSRVQALRMRGLLQRYE